MNVRMIADKKCLACRKKTPHLLFDTSQRGFERMNVVQSVIHGGPLTCGVLEETGEGGKPIFITVRCEDHFCLLSLLHETAIVHRIQKERETARRQKGHRRRKKARVARKKNR